MSTHVALLRGINVGGKNRLLMKDLTAIFENVGCKDVRTYIQSGNVVFDAKKSLVPKISKMVADSAERAHKVQVPILLRSVDAFAVLVKQNPFLKSGADPKTCHVAFLRDIPSKKLIDELDSNRSPGDAFEVVGSEIYLHCPNGMARTKLTTTYFDKKLATVTTVRNWNTILKLSAMLAD